MTNLWQSNATEISKIEKRQAVDKIDQNRVNSQTSVEENTYSVQIFYELRQIINVANTSELWARKRK